MKILLVVSNYYPNTAYTNRYRAVVRGFKENGAECNVLSIRPLVGEAPGCINNVVIPRSSRIKTFLATVYNIYRLKNIIKNYDVVYCVTPTMPTVKIVVRNAKKYNKIAVHERTEFPDVIRDTSLKSRMDYNSYLSEVVKFKHLFVISSALKVFFVEHGVPADRISIFPMIVDPHRFDNIKKEEVSDKYIAYCGNMNNSKDGIDQLIMAFAISKVRQSHKLLLIGSKPSGNQKSVYDDLISKYQLQGDVVFRGQVQRNEMPQMLKNADLLVLCRPNNRQATGGFPTKLGEYLSTGNPVLVTRVGDMDKYIIDGQNGYLSEPDNVEAFASKLDAIMQNYEEAMIVGQNGKELANSAFNYYVQTGEILNFIKSIKR